MRINVSLLIKAVLLAAIVYGAYDWWRYRPISHGPGVVAPEVPEQVALESGEPFAHNGFILTPLAAFRVQARVLGRENYYLDPTASISPLDLALGWGPMSDEAILDQLTIEQSSRWYTWRAQRLPLPPQTIGRHSANMHMIPANAVVERTLERVRVGQVVVFSGYLVKAEKQGLVPWVSSLTREDTGRGACEIVWVEELKLSVL